MKEDKQGKKEIVIGRCALCDKFTIFKYTSEYGWICEECHNDKP